MIDKTHIESLLKVNGLTPTSHDEEIRSVLLSARFNHDEVDAAVMILRENTTTNKTRVDGLHKVFRTDTALSSSEISSLLGIDVDLNHAISSGTRIRQITYFTQSILLFVSIVFAILAMILYMYSLDIGIFHPSSAFAISFIE